MIEDRIILGIDPGTTVMGYGLIQVEKKLASAKIQNSVSRKVPYDVLNLLSVSL